MSYSDRGPMLQAALNAQAAKKMQIEAMMAMVKQAKEELKICNAAVKREKELEREYKKRMKSVSSGTKTYAKATNKQKAVKAVNSGVVKANKKKKKAPKNPNFKRPRGSAPKSEHFAGQRKTWDYDIGGWKEPMAQSLDMDLELAMLLSDDDM